MELGSDAAMTVTTATCEPAEPTGWVAKVIRRVASHPASVFAIASAILGIALAGVAPPLRGPDETAHFLRAYGIGQGDLLASVYDSKGRKGIVLPVSFYRQFNLFESWQSINRGEGFSYRRVFEQYRAVEDGLIQTSSQTMFVPYGGSEGYSPAAYLPQAAAAVVARGVGLGFLETFYVMRLAGLLGMTAVITYAIALTPALKWPLVAIAMLPSALYGRAVINADAAALAYSLVLVAMFLRAIVGAPMVATSARSVWMLLCVLSKPPNLVFVLLEWLSHSPGFLRRRFWYLAGATLPALVAALLWTAVSSADVAAWRLVELTGANVEQFSPGWKLRFMMSNPLAFPRALLGMFAKTDLLEFWRQVIGVLGLFDTVLRAWFYDLIGLLLVATFVSPLGNGRRAACALAALVTALAYCLAIFLIFYLIWTPVYADQIWGVQGRYFVPVLPLLAAAMAAALNRGPDSRLTAAFAITLGLLSGVGSIDAILRADWNF
jgi:uncharacterized membrane protein